MTQQERVAIAGIIVATSAYYGQMLADNVVSMYVEDLADLPFAEVVEAYKQARRNPKTIRCPLPAVIRGMIQPGSNPEDAARLASSLILTAVSKYGWNNPDQARDFVGELGWEVVKRQGGWLNICEALTYDNQGIYQAQWRELAVSVQRSGMSLQNSGPALPTPDPNRPKLTFLKEFPK